MAIERRSSASITDQRGIGTGPYLARIVSHLDPSFMGSLQVTLMRNQGNTVGEDSQTYVVRCAQPFFGYTGFEFMGQNSSVNPTDPTKPPTTSESFNDTQKSYGMWFVPPDIGVTVLVIFVDGDPSQGYWIGCVPSRFANNMVPGIAGSEALDMNSADKTKYGVGPGSLAVKSLPVAEINRRLNEREQDVDPDKIEKAVHPIADRFLEQGLLLDDVRGVTSSSARREVPSMVFGISTPGPLDRRDNAKKSTIGTIEGKTQNPIPVSRLGGTQFVMDDGDDRYRREKPASTGPMKYIDVLEGTVAGGTEKATGTGDPTIPYNEHFRIRTRTGHQILMHNSEDLIYIGNAKGTTWIELTSNGKIDIYAQDSVSIHTQNDLNILADRDINLEAGRNINLKSGGKLHADIGANLELLVAADGKLTVSGKYDQIAGGTTKITTGGVLSVLSGGDNKFTTGGNTHIASGAQQYMTATQIHSNGPLADAAVVAEQLKPLPLHDNLATSTSAGWGSKYQAGTIKSIMKRVPMHEPWLLHENQAPNLLTPENTDRETPGQEQPPPAPTPETGKASFAGESVPPANQKEAEQQAMAFFVSKGYTKNQAAGIVGNLVNESAMNPKAIARNDAGPGKDSEGLAQWNRERLAALKAYADTKGKAYTDFQTQLEFVDVELNGTERAAGRALKASTTVQDATVAMTRYERFQGYQQGAASPETQKRIASASRIGTQFA